MCVCVYIVCCFILIVLFAGHKGSVRSLAVSNSEHFFLSSSKDRTVKLWLLRNQGGGSAPISAHLTYSQHQKSVFQVDLVPTTGDVLSCDGTVHVRRCLCCVLSSCEDVY